MPRPSFLALLFLLLTACVDSTAPSDGVDWTPVTEVLRINPRSLPNYASQPLPVYYAGAVTREVQFPINNPSTNAVATLGRVLFFDVQLSRTATVSCASCHHQALGFTDSAQFSLGFDGVRRTNAHSMRLANARFNQSGMYFWNQRATSLEVQTTQPILDGVEMGFDETHGGFHALIERMEGLAYYPPLFRLAFGDEVGITEGRVRKALAQYVRSIISVNSRWDAAYAQVHDDASPVLDLLAPLPGFTAQELRGRDLFVRTRGEGGIGCQQCHVAPSFSIVGGSRSNGLDAGETRVFRAPSLKNVALSKRFMHDGRFTSLEEVVEFYNSGIQLGPALDGRLLEPGGAGPQRLNLSAADKAAVAAFLRTLTDTKVTTDPRFASPFRP